MGSKPPVTRPRSLKPKPKPEVPLGFPWGALNWLLLGAGALLLVVGYVLLSKGSLTLAPILLVSAYCVFLPASLLVRAGATSERAEGGVPVVPAEAGASPVAGPMAPNIAGQS